MSGSPAPARRPARVTIVGISSRLGTLLARRCLEAGLAVHGTSRRPLSPEEVRPGGGGAEGARLTLERIDVADPEALEALAGRLAAEPAGEAAAVVYCCGRWHHGPLAGLDADTFEAVTAVGLRAPTLLAARLFRGAAGPRRLVLVTGLGGERTAVAGGALYSLCTTGVYQLVRSLGMELAAGEHRVTGVSLGLYDKGQPYIAELCAGLETGRPGDLEEVARVLFDLVRRGDRAWNGALVELSGGLFNYRDAIRRFESWELEGRDRQGGRPGGSP